MSNGFESPKSSAVSQQHQASPYSRPRPQHSRSVSELTPPSNKPSRQRRDEKGTQSAHPGLLLHGGRSSLDASISEGVSSTMSPDMSRRASTMGGVLPGEESVPPVPALPEGLRRVSDGEGVRREQEKTAKTVTSLKKSIVDLGDFSSEATRRLDETYYSVLEKMSVLQTSIIGLKELALRSQKVTEDFERDTDELANDTRAQVKSFNRFEQQRQRIDILQDRIEQGRAKISKLSVRVDVVRGRVEGWERADREWQERTRRRLKVMWMIMSAVFFAVLLLFLSAQSAAPEDVMEVGFNATKVPELNLTATVEKVAEMVKNRTEDISTSPARSPPPSLAVEAAPDQSIDLRSRRARGADERLRVFDEL